MMDLGLRDRVALVAGGTSGLGGAVASTLLHEGARVSICGRSEERLTAKVAEMSRQGGSDRTHGTAVDVTDHDSVNAWVDATLSRWDRIDVVVANAGGPPGGQASEHGIDAYRQALETNLLGSIALIHATLPTLRSRGWGRALFVTSVSAKQPVENLALSNTVRPGLLGYARSLVQELGSTGITVNVLAPGITRTDRLSELVGDDPAAIEGLAAGIPLGRLGTPEEFAAAAAFLCSEQAAYITGTVLAIDGGLVRSLY